MSWPAFFKESLIIGNPRSNIGICTLWSKKEIFAKKLEKKKYCVIGNLYTIDGISYIIKNILANPVINYIIVCGKDLSKSGEALIKFFEKGVDKNGRIIETNGYIHSNISSDLVELIRKNVKIIDLRGKEEELPKVLEKISEEGKHFTSPILLADEKGEEEEITSDIIGFRVEGELHEVWLKILDLIMKFGEEKKSQHALKQKEILNVLAIIKGDFSLKPFFGFSEKDIENYLDSFFSEKKPKEVEYTYGERLFRFTFKWISERFEAELKFFINQIDGIVKLLKRSPFTRRAVASLWNPFTDLGSKNPPCLTQITWNIKNGKLYQTCVFRSHDIFGAYLLNAIALRKLQENIAEKLEIPAGDLIILSQSAHVYENCWKKVERILEKYYRGKKVEFEEDKAGYFRIWIDRKKREIVVQHYLKDGRKSKFEFRGKEASSLYREILNENLISKLDHAAYLGKELARAEECLKTGKEYVQEGG